jgi:hypothetical protein
MRPDDSGKRAFSVPLRTLVHCSVRASEGILNAIMVSQPSSFAARASVLHGLAEISMLMTRTLLAVRWSSAVMRSPVLSQLHSQHNSLHFALQGYAECFRMNSYHVQETNSVISASPDVEKIQIEPLLLFRLLFLNVPNRVKVGFIRSLLYFTAKNEYFVILRIQRDGDMKLCRFSVEWPIGFEFPYRLLVKVTRVIQT